MQFWKVPGPNGYAAAYFYPNNWVIVEEEVCNVILSFLNSGHLNQVLNSTYIAFSLKVKNSSNVIEFRPILSV
jgi:hypothetical protein